MRKSIKKILVTTLAVTLLVPNISVSAYTFKQKENSSDVYEVSDIKNLQMIKDGATTDIKMLNDIVERAYNNDFKNKNYIIKNKSEDLGRWDSDGYDLWGNYVISRGDTYIATTFTEKAVVRDGDDYYHSVSVTSTPAWDSRITYDGAICVNSFNRETRSIDSKYWDVYMQRIENAEKEIGFTENNDLCDFQLILQTYIWIKDHVKSSYNPDYNTIGQTAIEAIYSENKDDKAAMAMCAGQSRLFNRFMHDFGIDSYWIDIPSITHALNFVKISNNKGDIIFGSLDCQGSNYSELSQGIYDCTLISPVSQDLKKYCLENITGSKSILTYDSSFVKVFDTNYTRRIEGVTNYIVIPKFTNTNNVYTQNIDCPYCKHLNETKLIHHSFTVGKISTRKNEIKKEHDKNIIENAGFEVYNNRFNYNTGGYDNFLKIEQGNRTEYETNTTTAAPTTTEEPTSDDSEVTKETTAPDVEVPTTTKSEVEVPTTTAPEVEVPTTASSPEPATSDRVVTPTNSTTIKPTKKPEPTTTVKRGTSNIKKSKLNIPANVKAKNIKKKSIKLTWRKTLNAKKYQVQYSTKSNFKKSVTKTTTKLKYIIKKLKKGKTYYIRLRAVNGKKISNWSKVKKIKIKK